MTVCTFSGYSKDPIQLITIIYGTSEHYSDKKYSIDY